MVAREESGLVSAPVARAATKTVTNVTASSTRVRRRGRLDVMVEVVGAGAMVVMDPRSRPGRQCASERSPHLRSGSALTPDPDFAATMSHDRPYQPAARGRRRRAG